MYLYRQKQPTIDTPPSPRTLLYCPRESAEPLPHLSSSSSPSRFLNGESSSTFLETLDAPTRVGLSSIPSSLQFHSSGSSLLSLGAASEFETRRLSWDLSSISSQQSFDRPCPSVLREALGKARRERPPRRLTFFYPADQIDRLITQDSVALELKRHPLGDQDDEHLQATAQHIATFAPRLFIVLVSQRLERHIYALIDEGIDDTHLPFSRLNGDNDSGRLTLCSGKQAEHIVQCMVGWDDYDVERFAMAQWEVLAPVFEFGHEIKHQDFDDNCILPWIEDHEHSDHTAHGGYGCVWKIKIHPAHQRVEDNKIKLVRELRRCYLVVLISVRSLKTLALL